MALIDSSEHSSRCSEAHLFEAEFSDFHVWKEDSVEPRCDQFDTQLFEAEYFADEDPVLVPADDSLSRAYNIVVCAQMLSIRNRRAPL